MRTTLNIDEELLEQVLDKTGVRGKSKAVNAALEEYVRNYRTRRLLDLQGELNLDMDNWDEFRHLER